MNTPRAMTIAVAWRDENDETQTITLTELEFVALITNVATPGVNSDIRKAIDRATRKLRPIRQEAMRREQIRHEVWADL